MDVFGPKQKTPGGYELQILKTPVIDVLKTPVIDVLKTSVIDGLKTSVIGTLGPTGEKTRGCARIFLLRKHLLWTFSRLGRTPRGYNFKNKSCENTSYRWRLGSGACTQGQMASNVWTCPVCRRRIVGVRQISLHEGRLKRGECVPPQQVSNVITRPLTGRVTRTAAFPRQVGTSKCSRFIMFARHNDSLSNNMFVSTEFCRGPIRPSKPQFCLQLCFAEGLPAINRHG